MYPRISQGRRALGITIDWLAAYAVSLGFFAGSVMGYINGLLVTRLRLPPFIVTLGTLYIFYDLSRKLTLRAQTGELNALDLIYTIRND